MHYLREIFAAEGVPAIVMSDNGLEYFMNFQHKEPFLVDAPNPSTFNRFGRNSSRFKTNRRKMIGTVYPNYATYLLEIVWLLLVVKSISKC